MGGGGVRGGVRRNMSVIGTCSGDVSVISELVL